MVVLPGGMGKRLSRYMLLAVPWLVTFGCTSATDRRLDNEPAHTVLPLTAPSPARVPVPEGAAPERWSFVSIRANERFGFMREGGVLALSLLDGAEIALHGSSVTIFMGDREVAGGTLTLDDARSRIVLDDPGASWLEGQLTEEAAGKRELLNSWATLTLARSTANDPRVRLCADSQNDPLDGVRSITRRAACDPRELELARDGTPVSAQPAAR